MPRSVLCQFYYCVHIVRIFLYVLNQIDGVHLALVGFNGVDQCEALIIQMNLDFSYSIFLGQENGNVVGKYRVNYFDFGVIILDDLCILTIAILDQVTLSGMIADVSTAGAENIGLSSQRYIVGIAGIFL